MAPTLASRKRKVLAEPAPVDDELAGVELDGVLSQSEDGSDFEESDLEDGLDGQDTNEHDGDDDDEDDDDEDDDAYSEDASSDVDDSFTAPPPLDIDNSEPNYRVVKDANGGERYEYAEVDPVYDSDDSDAQGPTNTIGNIPLSFYDSYPHIGYDINGKKIMRPATGEALDALLDSIEIPKGWTGLTDPETGKPLDLTQDQLELLKRLQMNEVPNEDYDPYPDMVPYFTSIEEKMPLSAAPEPKRRFVPSKHEAKRVAKLVRAIKEGRILPYKPPEERQREEEEKEESYYDVWANEEPQDPHVMNIPAPKLAPPGYDLSYNPPPEYLPTEEEKEAWKNQDPEEREKEYLPAKFDSLRKVPGYGEFVKERFDRCLDLYLAPRIRKNRLNIDPNSLLPKLPRPEDLKPFPTLNQTIFRGHDGRVRSVSFSPDGEFVASGGDDGTVRVWALNGHQEWMAKLSSEEPVNIVRWRPNKETFILAAAAGEDLFFMIPSVASDAVEKASRDVLDAGFGYATNGAQPSAVNGVKKEPPAKWSRPGGKLEAAGVLLMATVRSTIKVISWHRRGEFISTVSPTGQRSSVAIHTLSKHLSQIPFRKLPGLAQTAQFHPSRPLFFVATQRMIRCYDLQRQELVKVVQPGARWISSFDIHPGGDNLIVGSYDRRLLWHDLDLSSRPYKTMRFHPEAIRAVKFHRSLPLFADASDDGTLQIFHGKVVSDLMENATIVPVKMLKGHKVINKLGVLDVDWHPKHPWCLSAGADGTCRLWA
ncbi:ribosome biogenesis protein ERB1 [Fusarium oxysporum f. sp. lycopersici 4287]|uniref:Ribosome biogenesis protein ERB1 n=3 Tax=Fusarium oxysporum TaxID=5507 RepID=A0A0J9VFT2_FUSO4|nr:ribosome biogenesis protein ERB1 [Fusarium oxysporum f. sp. lycopersici 4287]EXK39908.1 ribosome biogenesis protein ERB1 [Fusarium oxysporum f. sp. melonis 26406]KNB09736.1 ribosome biogenesis protein ERB1 [Fusarium oxysporum f. sp. lycopersici 4287]